MTTSYEIKDIRPVRDSGQLITGIYFTLFATPEMGSHAEASWHYLYPTPVVGSDIFGDAEITGLCEAVATEKKMYASVDRVLSNRLLPESFTNGPDYVAPALSDQEQRVAMLDSVDSSISTIYERFQRFQLEHIAREAAAQSFKDSGYTGTPSEWVTRFSSNVGVSNNVATDLILSQANKLRAAIASLGNLRMDKYLVARAPTLVDAKLIFDRISSDREIISASIS